MVKVEVDRGESSFFLLLGMEDSFLQLTYIDSAVSEEEDTDLNQNLSPYSIYWISTGLWYSHCHIHLCCMVLWEGQCLV